VISTKELRAGRANHNIGDSNKLLKPKDIRQALQPHTIERRCGLHCYYKHDVSKAQTKHDRRPAEFVKVRYTSFLYLVVALIPCRKPVNSLQELLAHSYELL